MPLARGSSKKVVSENISRLSRENYPHNQAIAIALNVARKARRQRRADGGDVGDPMGEVYPPQSGDALRTFGSAVAGGLRDVIEKPGRAMREGTTTEDAVNWAAPMALGMIAGARLPGGAPEGVLGSSGAKLAQPEGIRAYHGSPHDFDQFDLSKIGTGEGAQAYGHGLYFAENPAVATDYRAKLSDGTSGYTGYRYGDQIFDRGSPEWKMLGHIDNYGIRDARSLMKDYEKAAAANEPYMVDMLSKDPQFLTRARAIVDGYGKGSKIDPVYGRMYEVNIGAHPDQFLDWDKPLGQMGDAVKKALNDSWLAHPEAHANQTGGQIYESARIVPGDYRDPLAASKTMRDAGIPGIKYLDQGSRAVGEGSRNYVVFDPSIVNILRKYAIPGSLAAGAGSQLGQHDSGMQKGGPVNSALSTAYSIKREGRAMGGIPPASWQVRQEARGLTHTGPILSAVQGRTDHHPMNVGSGSYVLPADAVSHLGQNNSGAGLAIANHMFGPSGPYGAGKSMPLRAAARIPKAPSVGKFAKGGKADAVVGNPTPILAAGGEFVVDPEVVRTIGGGDLKRGHEILDHWVLKMRRDHIRTLKKLPGPAKS